MKSKVDRLSDSIENVDAAIKYYLTYIENEYRLNRITRKDYLKLIKDLKDIDVVLYKLNFTAPFEDKNLTKLREINLSIKNLYEEGDYDILSSEMLKTNTYLCSNLKEKDRKMLNNLKKSFNNLSNFYKFRLSKAQWIPSEGLNYRDKGQDNIKFILEYYLNIKYSFKKIKYENLDISDINKYRIDELTRIIKSNECDDNIKVIYSNMRDYITQCSKAEVIIVKLEQMQELCNQNEYSNIKEQIQKMIVKYQKIYQTSKEKYDAVISEINPKNIQFTDENNNSVNTKKR